MSNSRFPVVMLVDDNELDNFINKKLLENEGFAESVLVHQSAQKALEELKKLESTPDQLPKIIFLDIMMPSANEGLELLERLRRDPQTKDMAIAMVTSRTDSSDRELAIAKGADAYFSKPFHLHEITQWASEQLRTTGRRAAG